MTTTTRIPVATCVTITAECPSCKFNLNFIPAGTSPTNADDRADMNAHGGIASAAHVKAQILAAGDLVSDAGLETGCESCGERFLVPRMLVQDIQWRALVLLGED